MPSAKNARAAVIHAAAHAAASSSKPPRQRPSTRSTTRFSYKNPMIASRKHNDSASSRSARLRRLSQRASTAALPLGPEWFGDACEKGSAGGAGDAGVPASHLRTTRANESASPLTWLPSSLAGSHHQHHWIESLSVGGDAGGEPAARGACGLHMSRLPTFSEAMMDLEALEVRLAKVLQKNASSIDDPAHTRSRCAGLWWQRRGRGRGLAPCLLSSPPPPPIYLLSLLSTLPTRHCAPFHLLLLLLACTSYCAMRDALRFR